MRREFMDRVENAHLYVAWAQFKSRYVRKTAVKGLYHLFACDWIVDLAGRVHLLECNGFPDEVSKAEPQNYAVWDEMVALVLNLHLEPKRLLSSSVLSSFDHLKAGVWRDGPASGIKGKSDEGLSVKGGYAYGGWKLIHNDLEKTRRRRDDFDWCSVKFDGIWDGSVYE